MSAPLRDARGCLTEAGLGALARAAPGQAPAELAAHVAGCSRCQERMLARSLGQTTAARRQRREPPPPWRVWVVLAALLLLVGMLLIAGRRLAG